MKRFSLTVFCILFSTWQYLILSLATCIECPARMAEIANGTIDAPFAYRILTPAIIVAMGNSLGAIALFQLAMITLFYVLLWQWCKRLKLSPYTMLPLFAMVMAIMMPSYYFSLYTLPEWNFVLCGLLCLPDSWQSVA
jgi:hypothetical protein